MPGPEASLCTNKYAIAVRDHTYFSWFSFCIFKQINLKQKPIFGQSIRITVKKSWNKQYWKDSFYQTNGKITLQPLWDYGGREYLQFVSGQCWRVHLNIWIFWTVIRRKIDHARRRRDVCIQRFYGVHILSAFHHGKSYLETTGDC